MTDLYREEILAHWQHPENFGVMDKPDVVIEQVNPLCGDEVTFYFKIKNNKVAGVSFIGNGCAISIASASMLSDFVKGKSLSVLSKISGNDVLDLIGGTVSPARLKCAFLPLEAIKKIAASKN